MAWLMRYSAQVRIMHDGLFLASHDPSQHVIGGKFNPAHIPDAPPGGGESLQCADMARS